MLNQFPIQMNTFYQLLKRDFTIFLSRFVDNYINTLCWVTLAIIVYQFIMPELGCNYKGDFILVSCVISKAFFGIMEDVSGIVEDLGGDRTITYDMTLPISHDLLFIKIAISNAIHTFLLSLFILPAGKLLLWNHITFPYFCFPKFMLIILISSLFSGFFSLFIIGITKSIMEIEDVWTKYLFTMSSLGGFQFTWKATHQASPLMSYINLMNPVTYMFEGMRGATLDPAMSISFVTCCIVLILFCIPMGLIGIYLLKRRLDAI